MMEDDQLLLIKIGMMLSESGYTRNVRSLGEIEDYVNARYEVAIEKGDAITYVYQKLLSVMKI